MRNKVFSDRGAFRLEELSYLAGSFNDKGKSSKKEQNNSSHLGEDVSPCGIKDSGFIEYFDVVFKSAVGPFRSGSNLFDIFIAF